MTLYPGPYLHGLPVVSASRLKVFLSCTVLFTAKYIDLIPIPVHPSAIVGKAVHRTIEQRWRTILTTGNDVESVSGIYRAALDEAVIESGQPSISSSYVEDGLALALAYRIHTHPVPKEIEYEFILPFPNKESPRCYIRGFFDYLFDDGFIDLKTSQYEPSDLSSDLQFIVYHWAFRNLFHKEPTMAYWYHIRTDTYIPYHHLGDTLLENAVTAFTTWLAEHETASCVTFHTDSVCKSCRYPSICRRVIHRNRVGTFGLSLLDDDD